MIVRAKWILLLLCFIKIYNCAAQESMMPQVSYPYLEKLIALARVNYPKVRMYNDKVLEAQTGISKARLGWFNALNFTYLYSPNNSTTAIVNPTLLDGYQFGVYINVGAVLVNVPAIKIAKEEYAIALDNQDEYNLNIEAIVKTRYFNYITEQTILMLRTRNAEDIESSMQQIKYKFEKGEETLDDYNKGLTSYGNAMQTKIEAEGQLLIAKGALEEMVGEKLEQIK